MDGLSPVLLSRVNEESTAESKVIAVKRRTKYTRWCQQLPREKKALTTDKREEKPMRVFFF